MATDDGVVWINRGRANCKGNTSTVRDERAGVLRTTCSGCRLEWAVPAAIVSERATEAILRRGASRG